MASSKDAPSGPRYSFQRYGPKYDVRVRFCLGAHGLSEDRLDITSEFRCKADADLLTRLAMGSAVYPILLVLIGFTTSFRTDHPPLFWRSALAFGVSIGLRFGLTGLRNRLAAALRVWLMAPLTLSIFLTASTSGLLYLTAIRCYGFANWTFTVLMLWVVGIASGSTISFTPSFRLLALNIFLLLGPANIYGFVMNTREGNTFALATFVLVAFLLLQGYRLHGMYWDLISARARERIRLMELKAAKAAAEAANEEMKIRATHDALTGVLNRSALLNCLERELQRAARTSEPVSVLMVDIDHFKRVNDRYGHLTGDEIIRKVVDRLKQSIRSYDVVGRFGGEEFIIVLPGCGIEQIDDKAESLRSIVASGPVLAGDVELFVTISIGPVTTKSAIAAERELLSIADQALYDAKRSGRNRVVSSTFADA